MIPDIRCLGKIERIQQVYRNTFSGFFQSTAIWKSGFFSETESASFCFMALLEISFLFSSNHFLKWYGLNNHNTVRQKALWHNNMCEKLLHFIYFGLAWFNTLLYLSKWGTITCPTSPVPLTSLHTLRAPAPSHVSRSSLDPLQFINVSFAPGGPKLIKSFTYSPITAE